MKRDLIKGAIIGCCLTLVLGVSVVVFAQSINVDMNLFRIKIGGKTIVEWGETYTLADGRENPTSLIYNDTTYLPLRKIGEALGKEVLWNDVSRTITITGALNYHYTPNVKKEDASGKLYDYSIRSYVNGRGGYLLIRDSENGNERAYDLLSVDACRFDDDGVVFLTREEKAYEDRPADILYNLVKIQYASTPNNQDGEVIKTAFTSVGQYLTRYRPYMDSLFMHGDYLYFTEDDGYGSKQHQILRTSLIDGKTEVIYMLPYSHSNAIGIDDIKKIDENFIYFNRTEEKGDSFSESITHTLWRKNLDTIENDDISKAERIELDRLK